MRRVIARREILFVTMAQCLDTLPAMKIIDSDIEDYCTNHSSPASKECQDLEQHTHDNVRNSVMLSGSLVGSFLQFLIKSIGAKRVLEFGTYTGYSALCMAEALPNDGEVITYDINPETTFIANTFWKKSPHGQKIKSSVGQALSLVDSNK